MIAVDTNILVYAHRRDAVFHQEAKARIRSLIEGLETWAVPWPCLHEFYSVSTNPRLYKVPTSPEQAMSQVAAWMEAPRLVLLSETPRHWSELREILNASRVVGAKVHDARIAALCRQHGVRELWSADRDFSRFAGITVRNPLV